MSATPTPSPEKKKKAPKDWSKTFAACILVPLAGLLISALYGNPSQKSEAAGSSVPPAAPSSSASPASPPAASPAEPAPNVSRSTTINIEGDGTVQSVEEGEIHNNFNFYSTDEKFLDFTSARQAYEAGDLKDCLEILQRESLADVPAAIVNIGYLYEQGGPLLGEGETDEEEETRIQTALSYYQKADTLEALRGQLSCQVKLFADDAILAGLIDRLVQAKDSVTLQYLALCAYGEEYEALSPAQQGALSQIDTDLLFAWGPTEKTFPGLVPPRDNRRARWTYESVDQETNLSQGVDHTVMIWRKYIPFANVEMLTSYQKHL